jgi:hypothetical protein
MIAPGRRCWPVADFDGATPTDRISCPAFAKHPTSPMSAHSPAAVSVSIAPTGIGQHDLRRSVGPARGQRPRRGWRSIRAGPSSKRYSSAQQQLGQPDRGLRSDPDGPPLGPDEPPALGAGHHVAHAPPRAAGPPSCPPRGPDRAVTVDTDATWHIVSARDFRPSCGDASSAPATDRVKPAGPQPPDQGLGVTAVGLDPIPRRARIGPGAATPPATPHVASSRASPTPVGPASEAALTGRDSPTRPAACPTSTPEQEALELTGPDVRGPRPRSR